MSLAVAATLIFTSASFIFEAQAETNNNAASFVSCPNGPLTIQGCIIDIGGCFYLNTINGRTIAIGIVDQGVGVGDQISLTGNWQTDADCAPCVLNATSVTDLGSCN